MPTKLKKFRIVATCYNCSKVFEEKEMTDSKIWLGKVCQECYDNEDTEDESSDSEDEDEPNKDDLYHGDEWINKAGLRHYYCKGCDEVVPITGWGCRPASDTLCESCEDEPVKIDYNKYPKKTHLLTCRDCGELGYYEDIADDPNDDEHGTCADCECQCGRNVDKARDMCGTMRCQHCDPDNWRHQ